MAEYRLIISSSAIKELQDLPKSAIERVRQKIRALAIDPRPPGCKKLEGRSAWRIRLGDYRILYEVDDRQRVVSVGAIRHRSKAYD